MVFEGLRGIYRELDHWDVSGRKRVYQYRPGSVIDPPAVVVLAYPCGLHQVAYLGRQRGIPGGGVVDGKEFVRKPVKVVDCPRSCHGCHGSGVDIPMSRNSQDGSRAWHDASERRPGLGVAVGI